MFLYILFIVMLVAIIAFFWCASDRGPTSYAELETESSQKYELVARSSGIEELLETGQFSVAERRIRGYLSTHLSPQDRLDLSAALDQALHGQAKVDEADKVAKAIVQLWKAEHRAEWLAQGKPKPGSSFTRILLQFGIYRITANQCYEPAIEQQHTEEESTTYYQIMALQRDNHHKLHFKLERTSETERVLLRQYFPSNQQVQELKEYPSMGEEPHLPDIRQVTQDVVAYLENHGISTIQETSNGDGIVSAWGSDNDDDLDDEEEAEMEQVGEIGNFV